MSRRASSREFVRAAVDCLRPAQARNKESLWIKISLFEALALQVMEC
jgi:hypothetical protein